MVIQKRVETVRDAEKNNRQDLHVLASSYLGILKQKCAQQIPESEFHQVSAKALEQERATNGDASKIGEFKKCFFGASDSLSEFLDKKPPKDRERSEKKVIKMSSEPKKETPAREQSRDVIREPTPREKSVKEVKPKEEKRDRETRERDDVDLKKQPKEKERRREKRATSPLPDAFEGDLSSVSNSSNGSIHPVADVVIVEEPRGELITKKILATAGTDRSRLF